MKKLTKREETTLDYLIEMADYVMEQVTFQEERNNLLNMINKIMKNIMY